jgi:hypothetical protein
LSSLTLSLPKGKKNPGILPVLLSSSKRIRFAVAVAFLVVIPEEPVLSEVKWGIGCCRFFRDSKMSFRPKLLTPL